MRHCPDSESGCTHTAPRSCALPRSGPCPAQVAHPRRRQVANFCQIISRQLRRLTGLGRTQEFRVATSTTPATLRFAHPRPSLPTTPRPAASSRVPTSPPYPEQRGPAVSPGVMATSQICACSQRIWKLAPDTIPRPPDRITWWPPRAPTLPRLRSKEPEPCRLVGSHPTRGPSGGSTFRRPRPERCRPAPGAMSLGPPQGPLPQTQGRLPVGLLAALPETTEDP